MSSRFIVIDGPDASGSTLHSKLLAGRLRSQGRDVLVTAEPTEGPVGLWIRELLREKQVPSATLQLLFTADRAWHVEQVILPALQEGMTVITDRYVPSTVAYGTALGLQADWLKDMNRTFPIPDATVFTLPPLRTCLERLGRREKQDILERRDLQDAVHAAYRQLAELDPSVIVLDTSVEKDAAAEMAWQGIRGYL
ncbi:MAG: dTMP kinase [Patescibacteria group bacterium]